MEKILTIFAFIIFLSGCVSTKKFNELQQHVFAIDNALGQVSDYSVTTREALELQIQLDGMPLIKFDSILQDYRIQKELNILAHNKKIAQDSLLSTGNPEWKKFIDSVSKREKELVSLKEKR